ncbi:MULTISPECIES: DEAD/DEAH box helicase family protein [Agrobacterium]|uniref:DEAD/DEAH box helicase family protein n=1 Tax=Agrobacterium TaxID=357 RepID=UPI001FD9F9E8|nr:MULTISPECIES: DEAD/DEAH box helicase family protein [Agrobacterium]
MAEFIVPALSQASTYDRGVGFFTSRWLKLAASGLAELARNGGRARIIASPKLSPEDCAALAEGSKAKVDEALRATLQVTLDELAGELEKNTLAALSWMIADGLLDFQLAVPVSDLDGDFHDKFGTFGDGKDAVAFRGSPNDSAQAFRNYESISVYYSWLDEREAERVQNEQERFDNLWENKDPNLRLYDLPRAIRKNLIEFTKNFPRPYIQQGQVSSENSRWKHQKDAISAFLAARRGVLEMATGTGKTRTAIRILEELCERGLAESAIVSAHGTDLLDQWYNELLRRTDLPVYRDYGGLRESLSFMNAPKDAVLLMSRQNLAKAVPLIPALTKRKTLLICDEVHGMGSASIVSALTGRLEDFEFRLGLSATPERAYDREGNEFIDKEIGPVLFRFTLEAAIKRGILCEFDYVGLEYRFSDEDKAAVRQAIKRHHAKARSPEPSPVEQLYQELARIRKLSTEKLPPFADYVKANPAVLGRCLIFVETAEYGVLVQEILMRQGVDYHTYYGDDDRANLKRFASGQLDCLVTCKRISEGIDIRSVNTIVLFASSRARLETVQRLGRCLRTDPSNPDKRALVIDFIRVDDLDEDETDEESTADVERRNWFRKLAAVRKSPENGGEE